MLNAWKKNSTKSQDSSIHNCAVCRIETENDAAFCPGHTPRFGDVVFTNGNAIFVGRIKLAEVAVARLMRLKVVRFWVGTDVLLLHQQPPGRGLISILYFRFQALLTSFFVDENWVDGKNLLTELEQTGLPVKNTRIAIWPGAHGRYERSKHTGFNIAYYHPRNDTYSRWKYGIDTIEKLIELFPKANWIKLDGNIDMESAYPVIDLYIRPSRHDGTPRINLECASSGIPVIYDPLFKADLNWFASEIKRYAP